MYSRQDLSKRHLFACRKYEAFWAQERACLTRQAMNEANFHLKSASSFLCGTQAALQPPHHLIPSAMTPVANKKQRDSIHLRGFRSNLKSKFRLHFVKLRSKLLEALDPCVLKPGLGSGTAYYRFWRWVYGYSGLTDRIFDGQIACVLDRDKASLLTQQTSRWITGLLLMFIENINVWNLRNLRTLRRDLISWTPPINSCSARTLVRIQN